MAPIRTKSNHVRSGLMSHGGSVHPYGSQGFLGAKVKRDIKYELEEEEEEEVYPEFDEKMKVDIDNEEEEENEDEEMDDIDENMKVLDMDEDGADGQDLGPEEEMEDASDMEEEEEEDDEDEEALELMKVKIVHLLLELYPHIQSAALISIEKIGRGTSNRVYAFEIPARPTPPGSDTIRCLEKGQTTEQFVIRVPVDRTGNEREMADEISREVATLKVVYHHLQFMTPTVIHYSVGKDNAFGQPYLILTRLKGVSLIDLWDDLNPNQQASAVKMLTQHIQHIAGIGVHAGGVISTKNLAAPIVWGQDIDVDKFPMPGWEKPIAWSTVVPYVSQTPLEWMEEQAIRWMAHEKQHEDQDNEDIWLKLLEIARFLDKNKTLGDSFHLMHNDLYCRNITAVIEDADHVKITGILDWDRACFAPYCVALSAPFWTWSTAENEEQVNDEPDNEYDEACKKAFRDAAKDEFKKIAFAKDAILARKLFKKFVSGVVHPTQKAEAYQVMDYWNAESAITPKVRAAQLPLTKVRWNGGGGDRWRKLS